MMMDKQKYWLVNKKGFYIVFMRDIVAGIGSLQSWPNGQIRFPTLT